MDSMKGKPKVVRVTRTEFELDDGRVYEHPSTLDYDPTIDDFQRTYSKLPQEEGAGDVQMKCRIFVLHKEVNQGKVARLEALHAE